MDLEDKIEFVMNGTDYSGTYRTKVNNVIYTYELSMKAAKNFANKDLYNVYIKWSSSDNNKLLHEYEMDLSIGDKLILTKNPNKTALVSRMYDEKSPSPSPSSDNCTTIEAVDDEVVGDDQLTLDITNRPQQP